MLINNSVTESVGNIEFNFLNVSVNIQEKSAIGDLFQEWFAKWLKVQGISYRITSNTQEFPDFLLDSASNHKNLLEVKTFDYSRSANFDVANFEAYCRSIRTKAYRLDADYLIFAYLLVDGQFKIEKLWLKKIWQITGNSDKYPVKCQIKQEVIYNIRPVSWYSQKAKFQPFNNRLEFVTALHQTLIQYSKTQMASNDWLNTVCQNYLSHTGQRL
ncbi:MAG: NgoBV family restriction endonuclease [Waterburya sp.]